MWSSEWFWYYPLGFECFWCTMRWRRSALHWEKKKEETTTKWNMCVCVRLSPMQFCSSAATETSHLKSFIIRRIYILLCSSQNVVADISNLMATRIHRCIAYIRMRFPPHPQTHTNAHKIYKCWELISIYEWRARWLNAIVCAAAAAAGVAADNWRQYDIRFFFSLLMMPRQTRAWEIINSRRSFIKS